MKAINYIFLSVATCFTLNSCELLQPDDIINPNVDENTFL